MGVLDNYFGVHGQALELRSKRMEMLASNIANAATPGFRARDLDFAAALGKADGSAASLQTTQAGHIGMSGGAGQIGEGETLYRVPTQSSLDGNTVELAVEQTKFGENAVQYQTTLSFLNGRISTLMRAMKGD